MNNKLKTLGIILISIVISMISHAIMPFKISIDPITFGFLPKLITLTGTTFVFYFITYSIIAITFLKLAYKLPGTNLIKGLTYGISIGSLWLVGNLEGAFISDVRLLKQLVDGFANFIPIVILCFLLSKFILKEDTVINKFDFKSIILKNINVIILFSLMFALGRFFIATTEFYSYYFLNKPLLVFAWSLLLGACIGIMYVLLKPMIVNNTGNASALKFGFILFGLNWGMFIFLPVFINGTSLLALCSVKLIPDIIFTSFAANIAKKKDGFL